MANTSNSSMEDKIVEKGMKYLFLHATGLTLPYLAYKVISKIDSNKKAGAGAVAAVAGIAALIGLEDEIDDIDA